MNSVRTQHDGVIMKPIPDKAEVALEYPDKFYIGTFERSARFDAHLDEAGISLTLYRSGDADTRRSVHIHLHYALFADILRDLAKASSTKRPDDAHRDALRDAAKALFLALKDRASANGAGKKAADDTQMTPEEEVLLLHVLE
jgi:hypothetical protein